MNSLTKPLRLDFAVNEKFDDPRFQTLSIRQIKTILILSSN